ncbi:antirepressor AbbA [Metabacillus malikii]|uniref:Antirepressor AbbA n=1 Tax=Metabacillus malikii TaxID=1504265 RepID=A0ABT9ZBA7_9BACI|nr:antirepressor AbbA [Metabacillus malikii]MDQ0229538.1 hypothetical protein [Metabacillus malikii]
MEATLNKITLDEYRLLVELLISQQYAIEIICSELNDYEIGAKTMEWDRYKRLIALYEKLRIT